MGDPPAVIYIFSEAESEICENLARMQLNCYGSKLTEADCKNVLSAIN